MTGWGMQGVVSGEIINVSRGSFAVRRDEAMRIRLATRTALQENRRHRHAMAQATRQELRSYREGLVRSVSGLRRSFISGSKTIGTAMASLPAANAEGSAAKQSPVSQVWELTGPEAPAENELHVEEAHVLGTINTHPEGVALPDLGNELGVDRRVLVGFVRRLLNDGEIEQIQQLLYPVAG